MRRVIMARSIALAGKPKEDDQDIFLQQAVIDHMQAIHADDANAAFAQLSDTLREFYAYHGGAKAYMQVLRVSFPMLRGAVAFDFCEQSGYGLGRTQLVRTRDAAGIEHFVRFDLWRTSRGWEMDGLRLPGRTSAAA